MGVAIIGSVRYLSCSFACKGSQARCVSRLPSGTSKSSDEEEKSLFSSGRRASHDLSDSHMARLVR